MMKFYQKEISTKNIFISLVISKYYFYKFFDFFFSFLFFLFSTLFSNLNYNRFVRKRTSTNFIFNDETNLLEDNYEIVASFTGKNPPEITDEPDYQFEYS